MSTLKSVRRATASEAEQVSALLQACGRDIEQRLGLRNWAVAYPLELIQAQAAAGFVWVLEENGELMATFTLDYDLPAEYQAQWFTQPQASAAYLHRLAVYPNIQGRGLGAHCLREVERVAREAGAPWLRFDAYSRNAGIQAFYRKQGFTPLRQFQMTLPALGQADTFTLYEKRT
ncbi:GNAT family N-acetyltransferase [Deinococcus fonticola]|uniref:GNAT family N-acetyltransferase n=1 Tax=Deinococcus fonticola TaxID=2528713 RepID=UPI00107513DC|nr:GNAT family N-acetyltransferase [Deinococcus fonticola]